MVCLRYVVVYTLNSYDEDRETRILLQAWLHEMHLNGSMRHYDYENDVHTQKPRVVENHANGASCNIFGCRSNLLMSKRKANESPQLSAKLASCRNPGRTRVDFVVFTVFTNSTLRQTDPVLGCQRLWLECTCSVMQDVHIHIHIRIRIHIHIHMYIYIYDNYHHYHYQNYYYYCCCCCYYYHCYHYYYNISIYMCVWHVWYI